MTGVAMAINPKLPTARKGPVTSSATPKGPAKSQQQRRTSVSQAMPKKQQQRQTSVSQAVPKLQQQRKNSNAQSSPKVVIQQQCKSTAVFIPTMVVDNKRKTKAEETSPTMIELQSKDEGADKTIAHLQAKSESPPKKQKIEEMKTESFRDPVSTSPCEPAPPTSTSPQPAVSLPSTSQSAQITSSTLLRHVLKNDPSLIPRNLPIPSFNVDAIAHAMWQVAFHHGGMLQRACQYSALFSPLKLAALAKLNFLPSWWFFRDMVVKELPGLIKLGGGKGEALGCGGVLDDGKMQDAWNEAVKSCVEGYAQRNRVAAPVVATEVAAEVVEAAKTGQEVGVMVGGGECGNGEEWG